MTTEDMIHERPTLRVIDAVDRKKHGKFWWEPGKREAKANQFSLVNPKVAAVQQRLNDPAMLKLLIGNLEEKFGSQWREYLSAAYLRTLLRVSNINGKNAMSIENCIASLHKDWLREPGMKHRSCREVRTNMHDVGVAKRDVCTDTNSREIDPAAQAMLEERREAIAAAIALVPPEYRGIVEHYFIRGKSGAQLVRILGMTKYGYDRAKRIQEVAWRLYLAILEAGFNPTSLVNLDHHNVRINNAYGLRIARGPTKNDPPTLDPGNQSIAAGDWTVVYHEAEDKPANMLRIEAGEQNFGRVSIRWTDGKARVNFASIKPGHNKTIADEANGIRKVEARADQPGQRIFVGPAVNSAVFDI